MKTLSLEEIDEIEADLKKDGGPLWEEDEGLIHTAREYHRLIEALETAQKALEPFAKKFKRYPEDADQGFIEFLDTNTITPSCHMRDFRKASEALEAIEKELR